MRRPIIELLPEETRSTLRSTQILTSLPQLVSELVQNSLDAGARQVDIGIDPEAWACWVRDDGCGIPREGLNLLVQGKEKGRYGTSKTYGTSSLHAASTFGFRGEALASAIDLASVEISSRTAEIAESWSIVVRGGNKLYAGQSLRWRRERPGTIVNIKDAFYNLPVRRLSHPTPTATLQRVKRNIENMALMFPHVGFTLENSTAERDHGGTKTRLLTIVKVYNPHLPLYIRRHVAGRISCADRTADVNYHPVTSCDLHSVIDAKFAATSFGRKALDETSRGSPMKSDRNPVYVLSIGVPSESLDVTLGPAKTEAYFEDTETVVSFLGQVVESFLTRNGYPPRTTRKPPLLHGVNTISPAPAKRRRLEESLAEARALVLPVGSEDNQDRAKGASTRTDSRPESTQSPPMAFPDSNIGADDCWTPWRDPTTGELYMIDKRSGNSLRQDRGAQRVKGEEEGSANGDLPAGTSLLVDRRWLRGIFQEMHEMNAPEWMSSIFKAWPNPTFDLLTAARPPLVGARRIQRFEDDLKMWEERGPSVKLLRRTFEASGAADVTDMSQGRLSKAGLARAVVLTQVDRKFIACKVPLNVPGEEDADDMLVLIDQHAADERIRVEGFLRDMCLRFLYHHDGFSAAIRQVEPPKPIAVTEQDVAFLHSTPQVAETLERWGFKVSAPLNMCAEATSDGDSAGAKVLIASIPDVVAVKLLLGDELREVVKSFLSKLQDEGMDGVPAIQTGGTNADPDHPTERGDVGWMKALRWCPTELVDLVNSRACR
ncbi:hypothetical protein CALCODRAFT_445231, partial [Calocera cornea HHB12733]